MKTTIAIADDHVLLRKGLIDLINHENDLEVVIEANDGAELISLLRKAGSLPAICILDISMPIMDGYSTIIELRKTWPDIKVLILSCHDHEYAIISMLKNGASGYLVKSCEPSELLLAIRFINANGFYYSQLSEKQINTLMFNHNTLEMLLTVREIEFLKHCATDLTYTQVAELMNISNRTIDGYRDALFQKLKVKSRVALAMIAIRSGLIS